MGRIRAQLFKDIADDAAESLAYFDSLQTTNNTRNFDGAGALENIKGQIKLFQLLMRRAANYCERQGWEGPDAPDDAEVHIDLHLTLTHSGLKPATGESESDARFVRYAPVRIQQTLSDIGPGGRPVPEIEALRRKIESETLLSCTSKASGLAAAAVAKPKRGRPAKVKILAEGDVLPKRRGRPPKVQTEAAAPKRRGRPPKVQAEAAEPKRRGRPRKQVAAATRTPARKRGRPAKR